MKIIRISIACFLAICLMSISLIAQSGERNKLLINQSESSFGFDGSSNIHNYSVNSNIVNGYIVIDSLISDDITVNVIRILQSYISIPVIQLKSKKGKKLESRMYKALKEKEFPTIDYYLIDSEPVTLDNNENNFINIRSRGKVSIAGVEKIIEVNLTISIEPGNKIRISGEKELLMKDFGVKRPIMFFKTIRTKDEITIKFDLIFSQNNK